MHNSYIRGNKKMSMGPQLIHKRVPREEIKLITPLEAVAVKVHLARTYTTCLLYIPHILIIKEELVQLLRQP